MYLIYTDYWYSISDTTYQLKAEIINSYLFPVESVIGAWGKCSRCRAATWEIHLRKNGKSIYAKMKK